MNGCEIMKCMNYNNGRCTYPGETCKYRDHSSVQSISLLAALIAAYEREVNPTDDWRDTALTEAEWLTATAEYRAAKAFLSANAGNPAGRKTNNDHV